MLFFTVIIVVSQFFPLEMFLATFYISLVGTYFVSLLALVVLFLPKFWNIWKNLRKPWVDNLHPSNQNPQRRSGSIGRPGSGGGGGGAGALGRVPDDFRTAPAFTRRQVGSATTTAVAAGMGMSMGVGRENGDSDHLGQPFETDPITTDSTLAPAIDPTAPTDGGTNQKPPKHKRSFSVVSMHLGGGGAASAQLDGNPLGAWMNSRVWRQGSDAAAVEEISETFMRQRQSVSGLEDVNDGGGSTSSNPGENDAMNENVNRGSVGGSDGPYDRRSRISQASISVDIPREHNTHNRVEFAGNSVGQRREGREGGAAIEGQGADVVLQEPLRTTTLAERTFGSSNSGAQRMV